MRRLSWKHFVGVILGIALAVAGAWLYTAHVTLQTKKEIPVNQQIVLTDPTAIAFSNACDSITVHASGTLAPGAYRFGKYNIESLPGTSFSLMAELPLRGRKVIDMAECSGTLSSSNPILVSGFPLPKQMTLSQGKASAKVDLVSMFGGLLINSLFHASGGTDQDKQDIAQIVDRIKIDSATFNMKEGRQLSLNQLNLDFGKSSTVTLRDVVFDSNLNYQGRAEVRLNLSSNTTYVDDKFNLKMKSGELHTVFSIASTQKGIRCDAITSGQHHMAMTFPRLIITRKRAVVTITADACKMISEKFGVFDPANASSTIDIAGHTDFKNGLVVVEKPNAVVKLDLPTKSPLQVAFLRKNKESQLSILAPERFVTDMGQYTLLKNGGKFDLLLDHPVLRSFALVSPGGFSAIFAHGPVHPRVIRWESGSKNINFGNFDQAEVTLRRDVDLEYFSKTKTVDAVIPLTVDNCTADLKGRHASMKLSGVTGNLTVSVEQHAIGIDGQLNSSIEKARTPVSEIADCDLHLGDISIKAKAGDVKLGIKDGELTVPRGMLEKMLIERLPQSKVIALNKRFLEDKEWRYKNMVLSTVTISNPRIDSLEFAGTDKLAFTAESDLLAEGTVDKHHILSGKWETKPWSATGHIKSTGTLKFTFVPKKSLAVSQFHYDAKMKLAPPEDVDIDWSRVADGLLGSAEHAIIAHKLSKNNYFLNDKNSQIAPSGDIMIFKKPRPGLSDISIDNFVAKPERSYIVIKFQSHADL